MMFFLLASILVFATSLILILSLILLVELITATFNKNEQLNSTSKWEDISVSVIIPAHNEEKVIAETLKTIIPQLKSIDRLMVIADNCDDRTAEIAKEMGVEVKLRTNKEQRGKGYVLNYGLQLLTENPPDIVIFIDADSIVTPETISILSQQAQEKGKPIQALYLMKKPLQPSVKDYISAFAFKVKNLVRPLGLNYLGQPCLLTGTGMAFPWQVINSVDNLASGEIVEDMKLGIDLAIAGYSPEFCSQAQVTGALPQKEKAVTTQRIRWEHGHLQTILNYVPLLFRESFQQKRLDLLILALDLSVPPLSLLVFSWLLLLVISIMTMLMTNIVTPLIISILSGVIIGMGILIAWFKFARDELPLSILIKVPLYILWKIPLYLQFVTDKETKWVRTERDN